MRPAEHTIKKLRLGPLPKTEGIKPALSCPASLKTDFDRYAALHAQAQVHGVSVDATRSCSRRATYKG
ncbi:hypothetical protein CAL22_11955 [Bordetella genomosp. 12]|uniref:Uncharacterized protein n=1 Tax=Bordetella genomosp. 12 TaxID=463035 RepID=A0A261VMG9_9BORD|nr:hypothetical protein CAL22_11955 [Bordetella genomosp. 12]